jgi:hypothetical protein
MSTRSKTHVYGALIARIGFLPAALFKYVEHKSAAAIDNRTASFNLLMPEKQLGAAEPFSYSGREGLAYVHPSEG